MLTKKFTVTDWTGLKSKEIVEVKDFFVLPSDNVAIRKSDFIQNDEYDFVFDNKYPLYYAVSKATLEAYRCRGEYEITRLDTLKILMNGRDSSVIHDKYKEDKFFYDINMFPLQRPFPIEFSSLDWDIFKLKEKLNCKRSVTKLEITGFHVVENSQKLKFVYNPKTKEEFEHLVYKCNESGWTGFSVISHIVDELDIAHYYTGD